MEKHTLELLEFHSVLDELRSLCITEEGRTLLGSQDIQVDTQEINGILDIVVEVRSLLESGESEPDMSFPFIQELLPALEKEGNVFEGKEIIDIAVFVNAAYTMERFIRKWTVEAGESRLADLSSFPDLKGTTRRIFSIVDFDGTLKDKKIPVLKKLKDAVLSLKQEIGDTTAGYFKNEKYRGIWQSNLPSQRGERTVLPLKVEYKNRVHGIVHEVSSTGATLFIEPMEIVEKNNRLAVLENQYHAECRKILRELSGLLRSERDGIGEIVQRVAFLDSMFARARYSVNHSCTRADISTERIHLIDARHPLLGKECVPVTITCEKTIQVIVISGPNTGGKTVTLKTVGLLSLMNQFGMEIPVKEGSVVRIFPGMYVDIGDEQSIAMSLSTFSGHMKRVAAFLVESPPGSLVLLDELGSGTDGEEGSALAMAVIDRFIEKGCVVLTTTHQNRLKSYAFSHDKVENASMEFDDTNLAPLFRLQVGFPGESHALDIAEAGGLGEDIIDSARKYISAGNVNISELIRGLNRKKTLLSKREGALFKEREDVLRLRREVEEKEALVRGKEMALREEGTAALSVFLRESRKKLENLVRQVKEQQASKEITREVKSFISDLDAKVTEEQELIDAEQPVEQPGGIIRPGTDVLVKRSRKTGKVIRKGKHNIWIVQTDSMRVEIPEPELVPVETEQKPRPRYDLDGVESSAPSTLELDVRGLRLEEALSAMEKYLDSCIVSGITRFSIIHGKGEGILQMGIQSYLKKSRVVTDFSFSSPETGGFGKTEVKLD